MNKLHNFVDASRVGADVENLILLIQYFYVNSANEKIATQKRENSINWENVVDDGRNFFFFSIIRWRMWECFAEEIIRKCSSMLLLKFDRILLSVEIERANRERQEIKAIIGIFLFSDIQ